LRVDLAGLKHSCAVIPGIRQVSKARLHEAIGLAPPALMDRVGTALTLYLGD